MDKNIKLLVLEGEGGAKDRRLGSRITRSKAITAIKAAGGKVRHDSGGRVLVVEVPAKAEKDLARLVPGSRLVPVESDVKTAVPDLDATESLFLEAVKIRSSKSFQDAKKKRKYGESPEEKEQLKGSDVREEL